MQFVNFYLLQGEYVARYESRVANRIAIGVTTSLEPHLSDAGVFNAMYGKPDVDHPHKMMRQFVSAGEFRLRNGDQRNGNIESELGEILIGDGISPNNIVVVSRELPLAGPDYARTEGSMDVFLAGIQLKHQANWLVFQFVAPSQSKFRGLLLLLLQTIFIFLALLCALAWSVKRVTDPIRALASRSENFSNTLDSSDPLTPSGADDIRLLINAHNMLELRVVDLLNQKDMMLRTVGRDLKPKLETLSLHMETVSSAEGGARMLEAVSNLSRMLDDILTFSEASRSGDPLERVNIAELVGKIVADYHGLSKSVELTTYKDVEVWIKPTWVSRAVSNLISNALRYGKAARVPLSRDEESLIISVDDDGPGIAPCDVDQMKRAFTRGERSRNQSTGGAGLGLALVEAVIQQHDGWVCLENRTDDCGRTIGLSAKIHLPLNRCVKSNTYPSSTKENAPLLGSNGAL